MIPSTATCGFSLGINAFNLIAYEKGEIGKREKKKKIQLNVGICMKIHLANNLSLHRKLFKIIKATPAGSVSLGLINFEGGLEKFSLNKINCLIEREVYGKIIL